MSEELIVQFRLDKDRIPKNQLNNELLGGIEVYPDPNRFQSVQKVSSEIVYLLDTSGSMNERFFATGKTKKEALIQIIKDMIPLLSTDETVSIVSFNTNAIVIAEHVRGDAKEQLDRAIEELANHNGQTNFENAMLMAQSIIFSSRQKKNKIVFLTDGHSCGGSDSRAFSIAKDLTNQGIVIDSVGIGENFDFDYMKKYSDLANGITERMDDLNNSKKLFRNIVKETQQTVITNAFMNIVFSKKLRDIGFYQHNPEQKLFSENISYNPDGTAHLQLNIGSLVSGKALEFLFECRLDTENAPSMKIADVRINYDCPIFNIKTEIVNTSIFLNFADSVKDVIHDTLPSYWKANIDVLITYNEASLLAKQGNYKEAAVKIKRMIDSSKKLGDQEKIKTCNNMLNKIMTEGKLSQDDLNRLAASSSKSSVLSTIHTGSTKNSPHTV